MGSASTSSLLLLLLATVPAVFAVTFQVGDTAGWTSGVDYTTWITGKTFRVGDTLEFIYGPIHSVSVVNKADFDGCVTSGAIQNFIGGDTKIDLTKVGTMHFLCPTPGHCLGGMKLAVTVLPAAATPKTPAPSPKASPSSPKSPSPSSPKSPSLSPKSLAPSASPPAIDTPESPSLTPTVSPTPSSPPQNVASKKVMSYGIFGVMTVLLYGLMS